MPKVISVSKDSDHRFNKAVVSEIALIVGEGVEGDAHRGVTVQHRSRVAKDPTQPNLRQVHLIHNELLQELSKKGFQVAPAQLGENILTRDIDLLGLPTDSILEIGSDVRIQITGLRNPCKQINTFQEGLMQALLDKDANGHLVRKAGVMGIVIKGGVIKAGDDIKTILPTKPYIALQPV